MKTLNTLLILLFGTLSQMGCMKYQYATVASNLATNDQQEFFVENDTLLIRYSFSGYGGPVNISIHNKLNVPLYVDWSRSALVVNEESHTYWQNKMNLEATQEGQQIAWTTGVSSISSTISGTLQGEESIGFIAPKAYTHSNKFIVHPNFFEKPDPKTKKQHRIKINTVEGASNALRYQYGQDNAPLKFRSYLTVSTEGSINQPSVFESEFWVAEVVHTTLRPETYLSSKPNKDKFYNSKLTGFGTVIGASGLLILGLLLSGE